MIPQRQPKKARYACERCRTRKQKCDSDGYNCSNCRKASLTCVVPEIQSRDYTKQLEARVAELEDNLRTRKVPVTQNATTIPSDGNDSIRVRARPTTGAEMQPQAQTSLMSWATAISLGYDPGQYLGQSSGIGLASMIQRVMWNKGQPTTSLPAIYPARPSNETSTDSSPASGDNATYIQPLEQNDSKKIVQYYVDLVHKRFPILDLNEIWKLHSIRGQLLNPNEQLTSEQRVDAFTLLMIYAAGLRHAQLVDSTELFHPEIFYAAAVNHLDTFVGNVDLRTIQSLILIVLYLLRSMSGPGIWQIVGQAMRNCVELGFHRKESTPLNVANARWMLMRRRVFWCTYSLERLICQSFGRPLSLSERDIDVDLPWDLPETITNDSDLLRAMTNYLEKDPNREPTSLSFGLHFLKVRRIDSEVQEKIYRARPSQLPPVAEMDPYLERIHAWRDAIPPNLSLIQKYHVDLMYNKCIRHALIPFLSEIPKEDEHMQMCLNASGAVCRVSKSLHQAGTYAHSFIALQTVFMCGLTLIYSVITGMAPWDFKTSEELQACSTVMFVVAEKVKSTKRYRDLFEALLSKTRMYMQSKVNGMPIESHVELPPLNTNAPPVYNDELQSSRMPEEIYDMSIQRIWNLVYGTALPPDDSPFTEFDPGAWMRANGWEFGFTDES